MGVEVKCSYVIDGVAGSTKASQRKRRDLRKQIDGLLALGLDRVALLDVIATTPAAGRDGQAWLHAMANATVALKTVRSFIETRLLNETLAGQFVWPVGAVIGGSESERGAGIPRMLRSPQENPRPYASEMQRNRDNLAARLFEMLRPLPTPRVFPVILVYCRTCDAIHPHDHKCAQPIE